MYSYYVSVTRCKGQPGCARSCIYFSLKFQSLLWPGWKWVWHLPPNINWHKHNIASWLTIASVKFKFTQAWIKAVTDKVMKLTGALL